MKKPFKTYKELMGCYVALDEMPGVWRYLKTGPHHQGMEMFIYVDFYRVWIMETAQEPVVCSIYMLMEVVRHLN